MAYRFQHRRDTEVNWQGIILADGEIGMIQRDGKNTNLYKIGDGKTAFENLPLYGFNGTLSNTLDIVDGEQPSNEAISKDTLVEKFNSLDEALTKLSTKEELKALSEIVETNSNTYNSFIQDSFNPLSEKVGANEIVLTELSEQVGTNETVLNELSEKVDVLTNKHMVLSQAEFDNMNTNNELQEGVFYYIYEEETE